MFLEILSEEQQKLLPLVRQFSRTFYLVGGTALALQIGHRRSIDFDLFTQKQLQRISIRRKIEQSGFGLDRVIWENSEQLHVMILNVKMTFFSFPFNVPAGVQMENGIRMPDLLTLAAMKAFALGGRAKWKDYVDLFFLFRDYFNLKEVAERARELFGTSFNEKLFREQLAFFQDINYEEEVDYIIVPPSDEDIRRKLISVAKDDFFI